MDLKQIIEQAEKSFDEKFYKNHLTRQWISRSAESYDSEHPQMGRAELLRFLSSQISKAVEEVLESVLLDRIDDEKDMDDSETIELMSKIFGKAEIMGALNNKRLGFNSYHSQLIQNIKNLGIEIK